MWVTVAPGPDSKALRFFAEWSPRPWPAPSSNGTNSSSTAPRPRWCSARCSSRKGGNELDAILAAFVTYAVGFAARPVGGIVFGQLGDRYGRKKLLQFSLLLVGAATFLMGCLPTFAQIGYWAPALLVVLRFIQGFAVGGEWGGAVLLVAEHSPNASRGFWASWPQAGVPGREHAGHGACCWFSRRRFRMRRSSAGVGASRSGCPRSWS